jgi:hypothetical protein
MFVRLCFVLAVLAPPFKSKSRLEAENVHSDIGKRRGKTGMRYFHGAFLQAALIVMPVALAKSASCRSRALAWCQIPRLPFHSPQDVGRSNAPNF